jgi:ribosomal protein S18 acetylase RimI-like enzyme
MSLARLEFADSMSVTAVLLIRTCQSDDLPLMEWYGQFRDHRELFADAFARHLAGENVMLVADLHGFPAGQAWIDLVKHRTERVGYIWAVRVFPFLRGLGIGTQLMHVAEKVLTEHGYRCAEVGVEKDNADARRLYERLGYRLLGDVREEYGFTTPDGVKASYTVDHWRLRKSLDGVTLR